MPAQSNHTTGIRNQIWQTYFSGDERGPRVLELATQPPDLAPTCPRTPEAVTPLQYSIGLLSHLAPCLASTCSMYVTPGSCLGVAGCVWCHVKADRESPISHPYCTASHQCHSGVLGGPSPYPHGLATLPHSDNTHGESGNPIGPGKWIPLARDQIYSLRNLYVYELVVCKEVCFLNFLLMMQ